MLMESGEFKRYSQGELVFKEGDQPSFTILLLSGSLEVFLHRQGREIVLRETQPGTIIGELAVICGIARSASLRAKSDSVVLQWNAMEFRRLLIRHPLLSERVLGQSLRNLIEKEHSVFDSLAQDQTTR